MLERKPRRGAVVGCLTEEEAQLLQAFGEGVFA